MATGTSSGKPSNAACGASPTSSQRVTAACRRRPRGAARAACARWSSTFVETWATGLSRARSARRRSPARRAGPRRRPRGCSAAMARASARVAGAASSRLNATSGARAATSVAPVRGSGCRRAEVGPQLVVRDAFGEGGQAALAQLRARASAGQLAVEEHGQAGAPELLARDERGGAGGAAAGGVEVDDRRDVERADVRVAAVVGAQVDELGAGAGARDEGADDRVRVAGERVDGAVVVGVGVDVEQPGARGGEGVADLGDDAGVAALGDVGDREQDVVGGPVTAASRCHRRPSGAGVCRIHRAPRELFDTPGRRIEVERAPGVRRGRGVIRAASDRRRAPASRRSTASAR